MFLTLCSGLLAIGYNAGAQASKEDKPDPALYQGPLKVGEVLKVGDKVITAEDLIARTWDAEGLIKPEQRMMIGNINYLRNKALLELESERMGNVVSEEETSSVTESLIANIKAQAKKSSMGTLTFEQYLAQLGLNKDSLETYIKDRARVILLKRLLVWHFKLTVDSIEPAHILVTKKEVADQIYRKLKTAKAEDVRTTFEDLAVQRSEDASTVSLKGRLPRIWKDASPLVEEATKALWDLKDDSFSKPVKTGFGYHIFYRINTRNGLNDSFSKMRSQLINMQDIADVDFNNWVRWVANTQGYKVDRRLPGYDVQPNSQKLVREQVEKDSDE
jgi:hypothetical protein